MIKENKKTKKVTIADLAKMIKEDVVDRMATKDDIENIATKDDIKNMATKSDIEEVKSKIQGIDKRIDDFVITRVKYEEHNKLKARVDFVEKKLEIK